ncbi:MAG: hypothetical protein HQL24_05985 [Candidatus Omnitrophica bacterium]|nr:hypothetical protein [Candidatus Omnitrophota bacterium]
MSLWQGTMKKSKAYKMIHILILISFALNTILPAQYSYAQTLPAPTIQQVGLTPAFNPAVIKGIKIFPDNPLRFDFIVDTAESGLKDEAFKQESTKLIKYFLASLTTPEDDMWVNLNPKEPDRIVPEKFGVTEMGRDLLAQDYLLKQITSSLMNPEKEVGKKFWDKIYQQAYQKYGTTDVPVDTLNKVWIIPDKAVVYERLPQPSEAKGEASSVSGNTLAKDGQGGLSAFVIEAKLKVMLEEEYEALKPSAESRDLANNESSLRHSTPTPLSSPQSLGGDPGLHNKATAMDSRLRGNDRNRDGNDRNGKRNDISSSMIKEIIIPELEKEVNTGKSFAPLRQIYYSMILATWFKRSLKESILGKVYVDQNKTVGVDIKDKQEKLKIYDRYLEAFKKGAYNYIKEEYDSATQSIVPKKYFSGGMRGLKLTDLAMVTNLSDAQVQDFARLTEKDQLREVVTDLSKEGEAGVLDRSDRRNRRPPIAPKGVVSDVEVPALEQQDLPALYWGVVSEISQKMIKAASESVEEVKQGVITEGERWKRINLILENGIKELAENAKLKANEEMKQAIDERLEMLMHRIKIGSSQQHYADAMAAWNGEEMVNNGNGDYENVSFPRDMALLYPGEMGISLITGQQRSPKLFYISGSNETFSAYYWWMKEVISEISQTCQNLDEFLLELERRIQNRMNEEEEFKAKIEAIQDELEALGVDKLKQVRFVDSGYKTFPLMFSAVLHMKHPEIKVKGLVQESNVKVAILPQLDRDKWRSNVEKAIRSSLANTYAKASLHASEDNGLLRHPFYADYPDGVMKPMSMEYQLEAYFDQLCMVVGAIKYQDILSGLTKDLDAQGKSKDIVPAIVQEALDIVKISEKTGDTSVMPTVVEKVLSSEVLPQWGKTAVLSSKQTLFLMDWIAKKIGKKKLWLALAPTLPFLMKDERPFAVQERPGVVLMRDNTGKEIHGPAEKPNVSPSEENRLGYLEGSLLKPGWIEPAQVINGIEEKWNIKFSAQVRGQLEALINSKHQGVDLPVIEKHNQKVSTDKAMTTQGRQPRRGVIVRSEEGSNSKNAITLGQEDLPDLYFGIVSEAAQKMAEEATRSMEEVRLGKITEEERWNRIYHVWKDGIMNLGDDAVARTKAPETKREITTMVSRLLNVIDAGSEYLHYAFAMTAWNGEEMIYNGNGAFENVSFPRDMGLLYSSEMGISLLTGEKRSPNLFYISGDNVTFDKFYEKMRDLIGKTNAETWSFKRFLPLLEARIKEWMKENSAFKLKIEKIQDELRALGIDKLKQVRFVDSGYQTFPLMFCAVLHMMNPEIKVKGLVQETGVSVKILPELNRKKWRKEVQAAVKNSPADRYAQASADKSEDDLFLRHPFSVGYKGIMSPTEEDEQLQAYWTQLAFVISSIKYQDLISSINQDLSRQGKFSKQANFLLHRIIQEALDIVHIRGNSVDTSVMPTLVKTMSPSKTIAEVKKTAINFQETILGWIRKTFRNNLLLALMPTLPYFAKLSSMDKIGEQTSIVLMKENMLKPLGESSMKEQEIKVEENAMNESLLGAGWRTPDEVIKSIEEKYHVTLSQETIMKLTDLINSKHEGIDMPVITKHNQKVTGDKAMTVMEDDLLSGQKDMDVLLKDAPDYTGVLKVAENQNGINGGSPDGTVRTKYVDDKGQVWLFKAYPRNRLHRAMVDEIAYKTSLSLGFNDGMVAFVGKIDGRFGAFVQWQDNQGSLWDDVDLYRGSFPSYLGKESLIRILREQVLDWLISQHDSHAGGFLKLENGAIFPIDKSQAFKYIGASDERLSTDYNPNEVYNGSNNVEYMPVYNLILKAIAQGKVKDFTLAEAWEAIQDTLKHVEEMNTDEYIKMLTPYAIFRFDVIRQGEQISNSGKFLKLARARKENLVEDFKKLYFKQLGLQPKSSNSTTSADKGKSSKAYKGKEFEIDEKGFLKGRIFSLEFLKRERAIAAKHKTIAIDLDESIASFLGWPSDHGYVLRPGIKEQLQKLKDSGFRLVLWTGAPGEFVQKLFMDVYPEIADLFDLTITSDSFYPRQKSGWGIGYKTISPTLLPKGFMSSPDKGEFWEEYKTAYENILKLSPDQMQDVWNVYFSPLYSVSAWRFKDITLLGYQMLVDNQPITDFVDRHPLKNKYHYFQVDYFYWDKPDPEDISTLANRVMKAIPSSDKGFLKRSLAFIKYMRGIVAKRSRISSSDKAMSSAIGAKENSATKGGIDLNPKNLTIESKGGKVQFNANLNLEELKSAPGFEPVIINVIPVTNVYQLLGLAEPKKSTGA